MSYGRRRTCGAAPTPQKCFRSENLRTRRATARRTFPCARRVLRCCRFLTLLMWVVSFPMLMLRAGLGVVAVHGAGGARRLGRGAVQPFEQAPDAVAHAPLRLEGATSPRSLGRLCNLLHSDVRRALPLVRCRVPFEARRGRRWRVRESAATLSMASCRDVAAMASGGTHAPSPRPNTHPLVASMSTP